MTTDTRAPLAEVNGRHAFITGGSSGIGLAIARVCSAAGMKVTFTYMREAHRDAALAQFPEDAPGVHAIRLDTSDRAAMPRAADEAEARFGPVHLLVNNAGVGIMTPLSQATWQDWDWALGVNLHGVFSGIHTFVPRMLAHGEGGHLVTTSSSAGLVAGLVGIYSTTKFAVVGMMESLRIELAGKNIGTSVLCPGLTKTDIADSERNRPAELRNAGDGHHGGPPGLDLMSAAMDPMEVARGVLEGIRRNDLYILTHPEFAGCARERADAIEASWSRTPAPAARANATKFFLPDIYRVEAAKRRGG
jgi:NAD(P)-dependent dehydrogenase (short-subunit alcohol dehydrogenase family)